MDRRFLFGLVVVVLVASTAVALAPPAAAQDRDGGGVGTVVIGGDVVECDAYNTYYRGKTRANFGWAGLRADSTRFRLWRCGLLSTAELRDQALRVDRFLKHESDHDGPWTVAPGINWATPPSEYESGTPTPTPTPPPTPTPGPGNGTNGTDGNGTAPPADPPDGSDGNGSDGTGDTAPGAPPCDELPPGGQQVCELMSDGEGSGDPLRALVDAVVAAAVGVFTDVIGGAVLGFVRGVFDVVTDLLADRPVPVRNGGPALLQPPTNPPMTTVYELWKTVALPAALGVWALFMVAVRGVDLAPPALVADRAARRHKARAWVQLPLIVVSFAYASLVLWLSVGLSQLFMPSAAVILPGVDSLLDHAVAGGVTGILLFLSSGILAVLIVVEVALTYLAIFVLAPALPLAMALELPDVSVLKYVASVGRSMQGWFVPCAFMPVPTAVILGLGYPVINALRNGAGTAIPGGNVLGTPLWVFLLLVMWYAALLAPVALLLGSRHTRPAALAVGALGALGSLGVASRARAVGSTATSAGGAAAGSGGALAGAGTRAAGALPSGGSDTGGSSTGRVDPVRGSPFATDGGTMVAGGGGSPSSPTAGGTGGETGATAVAGGGGGGTGTPTPAAGGEATRSNADSPSAPGARSRAIPTDQPYEVGYFREGSWQPVEDTTFSADWLADRGFDRMQEVHAREGHDLRVRGADDETVYAGPGSAGASNEDTTTPN